MKCNICRRDKDELVLDFKEKNHHKSNDKKIEILFITTDFKLICKRCANVKSIPLFSKFNPYIYFDEQKEEFVLNEKVENSNFIQSKICIDVNEKKEGRLNQKSLDVIQKLIDECQ